MPDSLTKLVLRLALAVFATAGASAADGPVRFTVTPPVAEVRPGGTTTVRLNLEIAPPYHVYSPMLQPDPRGGGPSATTIALKSTEFVAIDGAVRVSPAKKQFDPNFQMDVLTLEDRAWIDVTIKGAAKLSPGIHAATLVVSYQACTEESCLPPIDVEVAFKLDVPGPIAAGDDPRWRELEQKLAAPSAPAATRDQRWLETAELAWQLYEAHPADARRWPPWDSLLRSTPRFTAEAELKQLWAGRDARLEAAAATATDVPEPLRELFAGRKVSALVLPYTNTRLPPDWQERLIPPIVELGTRFPNGSAAFVYFSRLVSAVEAQAPAAMPALIEKMAATPNVRVRELATKRQAVLQGLGRPLELKFTAIDGREVDTTKWRGKVVLVDFWATWCVPCIEAMPHLKELYARYHDHGLEIVNISVDSANARDALDKLVARLELPWPQFFDGKANQTEYAVRYGVQPIPHVLLAGPDGMIVAVNPGDNRLEAEIKRLLKL